MLQFATGERVICLEVTLANISPQAQTNLFAGQIARLVRSDILENGSGVTYPTAGSPATWSLVETDEVAFYGYNNPAANPVLVLQAPVLSPSDLRLTLSGTPNQRWNVNHALTTAGPWTTLGTAVTDLNGNARFTDTNPPSYAAW